MVNQSALAPAAGRNFTTECPQNIDNSTKPYMDGDFAWDEQTHGFILGAFFLWLYCHTAPQWIFRKHIRWKMVVWFWCCCYWSSDIIDSYGSQMEILVSRGTEISGRCWRGSDVPRYHMTL